MNKIIQLLSTDVQNAELARIILDNIFDKNEVLNILDEAIKIVENRNEKKDSNLLVLLGTWHTLKQKFDKNLSNF